MRIVGNEVYGCSRIKACSDDGDIVAAFVWKTRETGGRVESIVLVQQLRLRCARFRGSADSGVNPPPFP